MIWNIAKKDFLLNLISARFIVGCLLCIVIIPFTITVNIEEYKKELEVYHIDVAEAKKQLEETRVYSGLRPVIVRPPNALTIFCSGISENLGNKAKINFGDISYLPDGSTTKSDNPFLNSFMSLDFAGIISILISLLALIFSYDLFTREREDGTMKLILSTGTGRSQFLSGKILGVFLTLVPILILCFLLSIFIILISSAVSMDTDQWINIILIFLFALIYMTVFILLGAFISSKVKHSSSSIIISLLCWIWFVFLSPGLASHIASSFVTIEKHDNIQYAVEELNREYYDKVNNEITPSIQKDMDQYFRSWWNATSGADGYFETTGTAMECMELERRIREEAELIRIDYADKKWAILKDHFDDLSKQKHLQKNLMLLSPCGIFDVVTASLSRNDEKAIEYFMEDIREYREILIGYFKVNKWFGDFKYITPQPVDQIVSLEEQKKITESGNIPDCWSMQNNPPLDLTGVPMFNHRQTGTPELLYQNLLYILLLLVMLSGLYLLTIRSFQKYDVR